jgi:hypothetical protein
MDDNLQARLHLAQQRRDPNRRIVAFDLFGRLYVFNIDLQRSYWSWFLWQTLAYLVIKVLVCHYHMEAQHAAPEVCIAANALIALCRLLPSELNRWTWAYGFCCNIVFSVLLMTFFERVRESLWGVESLSGN